MSDNKEQKEPSWMAWKLWLNAAIFLLVCNYLPPLAVCILMFVGEFFLWIIGGFLYAMFKSSDSDAAKPVHQ